MQLRRRYAKHPRAFGLPWIPCYQKLLPVSGSHLGDSRHRCALAGPQGSPRPAPAPGRPRRWACIWATWMMGSGWRLDISLLFCINYSLMGYLSLLSVATPLVGVWCSQIQREDQLCNWCNIRVRNQVQGLSYCRHLCCRIVTHPWNQGCSETGFFAWQEPHGTPVCRVWLCGL